MYTVFVGLLWCSGTYFAIQKRDKTRQDKTFTFIVSSKYNS